jgi:hypothetical protein
VVSGAGQTITLPGAKYSYLTFLVAAVGGSQTSKTFTVNYTIGSPTTFQQSFSDWASPQGYSGESKAVTMSYRNLYTGHQDTRNVYLYAYTIQLDSTRQVQTITLPNDANLELFAIDLIP